MTDDLDRILRESGARWRDTQPAPPVLDPASLTSRRTPPRWVVPFAAAAAVAAVVAGGAVLLGAGDDGRTTRPEPGGTVTPTGDAAAGVVPWVAQDRHYHLMLPYEEVYDPPLDYADGVAACTAGQITATSRVTAALGTTGLDVTFRAAEGERCSLAGQPAATLLDGGRELDVRALPGEVGDGGWQGGAVLLDATHDGELRLSWNAMWCVDPVRNDRVGLTWGEGVTVEVDGFGSSPGCNDPGSHVAAPVDVWRFEPADWTVTDGAPTLAPLRLRQVSFTQQSEFGPATAVVELTATERDLTLLACPDAELRNRTDADDETVVEYGLNCAGVPYVDDDGVPYLPQGEPVRFAVRIPEWGDDVLPTYTWVLHTPDEVTIPLER